jgi:dCMP deaminase
MKKQDDKDLYEDLNNRPSWDEYYLTMAFVVAQRSFDPSSKCGCVIVSKDNRVLSTGYNGPLKKSIDSHIPLTRPEKYFHMIHGEENALLAYSGSAQDIQDGTAYITGRPCHRCLRDLLQKGITRIVYGPNVTKVLDEEDFAAQQIMLEDRDVSLVEISKEPIQGLLKRTVNYIEKKSQQKRNY